jgi:thiol-disulfide isomerase/thioredoxin
MRSLLSIICTIISIVFVSGCASSSKDDKTEINITSQEYSGMEVSLSITRNLPLSPKEIHTSQFDSLGHAGIEFSHQDTLHASLKIGEWEFYTALYLEPGSTIYLTIEDGLPTFDGDLKIINSYYHKIYLNEREGQEYVNANCARYISASSSEQQVYFDSLTTFGTELKKQIERDNSISDYYRKILIDKLSLFEITQRMYFDMRVDNNDIINKGKSVVLDSTLSNAFEGFSLQHKYIKQPNYIWYVNIRLQPIFNNILNYHYENGLKVGEYEYIKGAIEKDTKLNDFQDLLMAIFIFHTSASSEMDYNLGLKLVNSYKKDYPRSKYLKELEYMLAKFSELKAGMPMKDIEMHDTNGKAFSASSLKGNLVYIDVWATWCGPCIDELEYSKKLSKKYSNHPDLKFLYVSIDEDTERWKKFLKKNPQIKGLHGLQNSGFIADSSLVTSLYKISGIPRYILINKEGNIITANARRPSQLLSGNYLDSLLAPESYNIAAIRKDLNGDRKSAKPDL